MKGGVLRVVRYLDQETRVFVKSFCEPPYAILLIARLQVWSCNAVNLLPRTAVARHDEQTVAEHFPQPTLQRLPLRNRRPGALAHRQLASSERRPENSPPRSQPAGDPGSGFQV